MPELARLRQRIGQALLNAADRHDEVNQNWAEARNAFFEGVAEGVWSKEALREMYREGVRRYNAKASAGDQRGADAEAAFVVMVAEASLYAKEEGSR